VAVVAQVLHSATSARVQQTQELMGKEPEAAPEVPEQSLFPS
jgi:hypothetical protein